MRASQEFKKFLQELPTGGSAMGECWYHEPNVYEGVSFQKGPDHYLVEGILYCKGERKLRTILKGLEIAKRYQALTNPPNLFFQEEITYNAQIVYGDPLKLGGYENIFSGTPEKIKARARELENSMWQNMNCNGNPYVAIKIDGKTYNKNLKLPFLLGSCTLKEYFSLEKQELLECNALVSCLGCSPSLKGDLQLAAAHMPPETTIDQLEEAVAYKGGRMVLMNQSVIFGNSGSLRESWGGLVLA